MKELDFLVLRGYSKMVLEFLTLYLEEIYYKIRNSLGKLWASLVAQTGKNLPAMQETQVQSWVGKIL